MNIIFYAFVISGIFFYIYLITAYFLNKKRDRLIDEMERDYAQRKFIKCPHCGVLNPLNVGVCDFCKKAFPPPPQSASPPSETEPVQAMESEKPSLEGKAFPSVRLADKSSKNQLESFLYRRALPLPNSTALVAMTSVFLLVIFIYGFIAGIYSLGRQGVKQLEEVSREAAKRQAKREASDAHFQPSSPAQPSQTLQVSSRETPTPIPTITPLSVSGSDEEQIALLMIHLESGDWNVAIEAKKLLIEKGDKAAPSLALEINHPDSMVRAHVITALGEIAAPDSIPALITALSHDDPVTVIQAATALGQINGDGVMDALIHCLEHPDWRVRRAAALSLENQGNPAALPALLALKDDPNESVRNAIQKAASALRRISEKE